MNTKKNIGILVIGICIIASITLFISMPAWIQRQMAAQAKIQGTSGVYAFNRASDRVRFTCELRRSGVCFLGLEIPGTNYSTMGGDIPAAVTRDGTGLKGGHGLEGKWEVRDDKVYLFTDGQQSAEFVIQGRNLVTVDGASYVRAE